MDRLSLSELPTLARGAVACQGTALQTATAAARAPCLTSEDATELIAGARPIPRISLTERPVNIRECPYRFRVCSGPFGAWTDLVACPA
jgi:hypothetical protein